MKIHLLRHAKTNPNSESGLDIDRELLPKGVKQASLMSSYLDDKLAVEVHCSSSKRTRQTFDLVFKDKQIDSIHFSQELYLASERELLHYVNQLTTKKDLFIIGHNNGLSDFASYISGDYFELKTCEYVVFEVPINNWNELSKELATSKANYHPKVEC